VTPRRPRAHWVALVAVLMFMTALLIVAGATAGTLGEHPYTTDAGSDQPRVPRAVLTGGPILDATRPSAAGLRVPDHTIALTFDDGPSRYTPAVLRVLERYDVPATFFVVGAHVGRDAALLRRMVAAGDEIGIHTFSHPDLAGVSSWRESVELSTSQVALAAATGYTTDLLRLPFSSEPSSLTPLEWRAIKRAGRYRVVLADVDTEDWRKPGVASIVAAGTPAAGAGAVVMLHDGGGDRSQTVAALNELIPALRARGYRFTTVSHAIGVGSPWSRATGWQRTRGSIVLGAVQLAHWLVVVLRVLFFIVGALAVLRLLMLVSFARRHAARAGPSAGEWAWPGVSIVVPAYNEQLGIGACIQSLLASDYPAIEVIVVDDGSTDGTASAVTAIADHRVHLIQQANSGKPGALNTGIAAATHDVLVLVDGDTVFEPSALRALVAPFAEAAVGAVSGNTKVGNRRGLLGRWQHLEYVIGFNLDRRMFDVLQCMPTVPGAIGAFRRQALDEVGGISDDTLAEDTDVTMAICRAGWRVVYAPDARAWTEAPATFNQLWQQRYRWCYGTLQSMWKHRHSVVERGPAGRLGRRGLPYLLLFQVLLPLLAPAVDVAAVYSLFTADARLIGLVWLGFLGLQWVAAGYAFRLDGERLRTLWALPLQQVVYRQLMYLVVIQSVATAGYGIRLRWHKLRRTGAMESAPSPVA
jgi:peptidoglycan/xylan/chitin deacetylase (PgdA/CDA1 family)/GT2 family glycosyltransferase